MASDDIHLRITYFHEASDDHLQLLGVDRAKLPTPQHWQASWSEDMRRPMHERSNYGLVWELDGLPVGFSTADKIVFGEEAYMHLHILHGEHRGRGWGTEFVRRSASAYFKTLQLNRLFCEPHAFNVAPNRTLQRAGFKYLFTHRTVPNPLNFHQTANRWILTAPPRPDPQSD